MRPRVTIKDIAQETGFSVTTISLVLNDKAAHIPLETKRIIAQAVKSMGYRPNKMAVGLVKKTSNIVGFVLPDIRNQFFSHVAKALEDECYMYKLNLLICNSNNNYQQEMAHLKTLCDYMVSGIFLSIAAGSTRQEAADTIQFLENNNVPYCLIDRDIFNLSKYKVSVNHFHGAYTATEHLIKLGHKKIGCITGPLNLDDGKQRFDGYKKAMLDYNLSVSEDWIYFGDYSFDKGKLGGCYLADQKVTAVFAANDFSAMGALAGIKERGLSVPEDISLVGYDDIDFAAFLEVPLTTVRQPIGQVGKKAVQLLYRLIEQGRHAVKTEVLEPELIVRRSTREYA